MVGQANGLVRHGSIDERDALQLMLKFISRTRCLLSVV